MRRETLLRPGAQSRRAGLEVDRPKDARLLGIRLARRAIVGAPEVGDVARDERNGIDWRLPGCGRRKQAERPKRLPHVDQGTPKADRGETAGQVSRGAT